MIGWIELHIQKLCAFGCANLLVASSSSFHPSPSLIPFTFFLDYKIKWINILNLVYPVIYRVNCYCCITRFVGFCYLQCMLSGYLQVDDLGKLLGLYAEWHSHLIPYYSFDQFVHKVEQVGCSKRVKVKYHCLSILVSQYWKVNVSYCLFYCS